MLPPSDAIACEPDTFGPTAANDSRTGGDRGENRMAVGASEGAEGRRQGRERLRRARLLPEKGKGVREPAHRF